jgi:hypothetical protein
MPFSIDWMRRVMQYRCNEIAVTLSGTQQAARKRGAPGGIRAVRISNRKYKYVTLITI